MHRIKEVIVVEGRYDKNSLSQVVDAQIVETSGFGIFKNSEKQRLFRRLAEAKGLIVLTDSDGAGFMIRNFIRGCVDASLVKHAYIPDIYGKERRKARASKEGKLGVEGMSPEILLEALIKAGATIDGEAQAERAETLSKTDFYMLGLTGGENSREKRTAVLKALELPARMTTDAMIEVINATMTKDEFLNVLSAGQILDADRADDGN